MPWYPEERFMQESDDPQRPPGMPSGAGPGGTSGFLSASVLGLTFSIYWFRSVTGPLTFQLTLSRPTSSSLTPGGPRK